MEPLSPAFRESLKRAHPDLRDRDIDEFEELTVRRAMTPPDEDSEAIRELDRSIDRMIQEKMPRFQDVAREHAARLREVRDLRPDQLTNVEKDEGESELTS
jgi:hypothetical protein